MNRPRHWPKQGLRLLDNYRPLLILTLAILFSLGTFAQRYDSTKKRQAIPAYGFEWNNAVFKESLGLPATGELRPRAIKDTGQVAYFNGYGYIWALRGGVLAWYLNGGGGSGSDVELIGDSLLRIGTDTIPVKFRPSVFESDFSPPYAFKDGDTIRQYPRLFALDSLLWNIYATRQTKSTYLDSLRGLVGRFDNALIPPSDSNTVKNGIANFGGNLYVGDGAKYSKVFSEIISGYGINGNGSTGSPLIFDSSGVRADYIRNQFLAKENKSGWFTKARLDSLYSTKIALGAIDPAIRNLIFIAIDTGSSPFEGYLHHKMGYRSRIVDRISRARGSHASPTSLIVGDPLYTEQISMYGSAGYTTPYAFHDIWLKSVPTSTAGTSIYQQWATGPSTTSMVLQLDSNGVKIGRGLPGFSGTYDSSKNSLDVIGSVGTRVRSVTGTAHTATTNDHTILISADGGSSFVLTLPNPATAPRREYVIKRIDSTLNLAYMKPTAGKVEGLDSMFIDRFSWVTIQSDSVNWHVVSRSSDTRLDALEQARNGFSYYQEFISNALFTDGYIFGNASGAGAGVGRGVAVPAALQATNRPGITYVRAGTTTTGRAGIYSDLNFRDNIILGGSTVVYETTVAFTDLSDGTDRYQAIFGLHDVAGVNATDGVYFLYDEGGVSTGSAASGNWQIVTASAASRTFNTTSVTVAANTWYRLRIEINKSASEVRFYINGTQVGPAVTTTIPSGVDRGTIIQNSINKSLGTNDRVFAIDYLFLNMRFNTPRY